LSKVELISGTSARRWEQLLIEQLKAAGHCVSVTLIAAGEQANERALDRWLALMRKVAGPSLSDRVTLPVASSAGPADLVIDLTGAAPGRGVPVIGLDFGGHRRFVDGLAGMIASGTLPEVVALLDGVPVNRAAPMVENPLLVGRLASRVLAGSVWLLMQTVSRYFSGRLKPLDVPYPSVTTAPNLSRAYLPNLIGGLAARAGRKFTGQRVGHWQVGYRLIDGPGIAETGRMDGAPFAVVPDDGKRFYADPFVAEHKGRHFLFVEELPYATNKGVISAAELGPDGSFGPLHTVIEEPHHLSYPQILVEDGEIYMLPESSGGRELVLYRAVAFPDRWERHSVLLSDTNINDATLLIHGGRHWLIGTSRLPLGSSSDTMVIYSAPKLGGPWTPHPLNPIVIDRTSARPGGAIVRTGGRILLPVQNGTHSYGGGLGLMELIQLDDANVIWGPVGPIEPGSAWDRRGLHTLNRAGRLEVVDSTG